MVRKAWDHVAGGEGYDAREVLLTLFDKYPERADKETTLLFAYTFEVEGRIYKAENWTRSLLEEHPDYIEAWEFLAHLLSRMEYRQDDLQETVNRVLGLNPESISALRSLAHGYYSNDDYDKAIEIYENITTMNPSDPLSWDQLAHTLYWAKRYNQSLECWRKKLELRPDDDRAKHWVSELERMLSDCK